MNFTQNYTLSDQQMVIKINAELAKRKITPQQAGTEFNDSFVPQILDGTCTVEVQPRLSYMFEELFGTTDLEGIDSDNTSYADSYTADDQILCAKIRQKMAGKDARRMGRTASNLSKELGISPSLFSQLTNGTYKASPTQHLDKIWAILAPLEAQSKTVPKQDRIVIKYGQTPHVDTSISNLIKVTCVNAKNMSRFAVFAGQAGLGKTQGIKKYCSDNPDAILLNGGEMVSKAQIINQLCHKLGISKHGTAADRLQTIIITLRNTNRVIILDEADKCQSSALHPLRTISDEAAIGIALIGNLELSHKLQTDEVLDLIHSRTCFAPKPVSQITIDDVKTLFKTLTKNHLKLAEDTPEWWQWMHKRVSGKARALVENLLPHLLNVTYNNPDFVINRQAVNEVFVSALNAQPLGDL